MIIKYEPIVDHSIEDTSSICSKDEIVKTQVLVNCSHPISLKVNTLEFMDTTVKEQQNSIKLDLLTEESYEAPYYRDVIHDYLKLLIQKLICQVWIQHWSDWITLAKI